MRTNIKTTNVERTPAMDTLAEEKLIQPIERLIADRDAAADVLLEIELELTTHHHRKGRIWRAEVQLELPHGAKLIRGEADGESLEEAVNLVKSTILDEIKAVKERERDR